MALFVDDLGEALETAIKANASAFSGALDSTASTLHVEYSDTHEEYNIGAGGSCKIRFAGSSVLQSYTASALSTFAFRLHFDLQDVAGANRALAVVQQGMFATFGNRGLSVLDTHLTDSGSNRLGKSGSISFDVNVEPIESLRDRDQAIIEATVEVTIWHKLPLA